MRTLFTMAVAVVISLASVTGQTNDAQVSDVPEIEIEVVKPLSFGLVVAATGGEGVFRLAPETGQVAGIQGSKIIGGRPSAMSIHLTGLPHCRFDVITPAKVNLSGSAGNSILSEIQSVGDIAFDEWGEASIRIGGLLTLNAQLKGGTQQGEALINVEYQPSTLQSRHCKL